MATTTKPKTKTDSRSAANGQAQTNGQAPQTDTPDLTTLLGEDLCGLIAEMMRDLKAHSPRACLCYADSRSAKEAVTVKTDGQSLAGEHTCELSGYGFTLPKGSPVPAISYHYARGDDEDTDHITVHPGLFARGPQAITEALSCAIEHFQGEAAWLLARCAEYAMLLEAMQDDGLPLDWPDYWLDPEAVPGGEKADVWQGLRRVGHLGFAGLRI